MSFKKSSSTTSNIHQSDNNTNYVGLKSTLAKFADQVERIRCAARQHGTPPCWAGILAYSRYQRQSIISHHKALLYYLQTITKDKMERVIDCVSLGENIFAHFWQNSAIEVNGPYNGPVWHTYELDSLALPYLLSNLVLHVSDPKEYQAPEFYFPIPGGKEMHRKYFVPLDNEIIQKFDQAQS